MPIRSIKQAIKEIQHACQEHKATLFHPTSDIAVAVSFFIASLVIAFYSFDPKNLLVTILSAYLAITSLIWAIRCTLDTKVNREHFDGKCRFGGKNIPASEIDERTVKKPCDVYEDCRVANKHEFLENAALFVLVILIVVLTAGVLLGFVSCSELAYDEMMRSPDSYDQTERDERALDLQANAAFADASMKEDFQSMSPESQDKMLDLLALESALERTWWEKLLLE